MRSLDDIEADGENSVIFSGLSQSSGNFRKNPHGRKRPQTQTAKQAARSGEIANQGLWQFYEWGQYHVKPDSVLVDLSHPETPQKAKKEGGHFRAPQFGKRRSGQGFQKRRKPSAPPTGLLPDGLDAELVSARKDAFGK